IESRLTELSDKEIDDEVDEEDKQILQVNEVPHSDLDNYFVIKDGSAPDPETCTVDMIDMIINTKHVVHVRNYLNQPIDIKTSRIKCKHSQLSDITCSKIMGKKGEYEVEFSARCLAFKLWFQQTRGLEPVVEVLIDEFIVRPMIIQE
ncbi:hypothetical protein AC249_AIPGENE1985, partial [Exaiptasia diaphana]